MTLSASAAEMLARLPGPVTEKWPGGERFVRALAHGTMSVELYAPVRHDPQMPHAQDELYLILAGAATLVHEGTRTACAAGSVHFVPAGDKHHFESISPDFATWVVFWGPVGGESAA